MQPSEAAMAAIAGRASDRRPTDAERWRAASGTNDDLDRWTDRLTTAGRLTVNFHPDRIASSGLSVAEGLATTGAYLSQWSTAISNGGRSAFPGGDRNRWEHQLFGGAYDGADPTMVAHPIYGALDLLGDAHGGSPRFGSSYLVVSDEARRRTTLCVGDSHEGPADVGTVAEPWGILAGLAEQAARSVLLNRSLALPDLFGALDGAGAPTGPSRDLDGYVEAQIHGGVELSTDIVAIVLDPSFRHTSVERHLTAAAHRYGCRLGWHAGSELDATDIPADFRGPTMPDLGRRVARDDGVVDAAAIGHVAAAIAHGEMLPSGDPPESDAQQLKRLWHTLLAFGRDAESPADAAPH